MWRLHLVPILILGLLVCPLRCAVGAAFGGASSDSATSTAAFNASPTVGCACCAPQAVTTDTAASETSATESGEAARVPANSAPQNCGCSSCICAGAILQSDSELLSTASGDGWGADLSGGFLCSVPLAAAEPVARASTDSGASWSPPGRLLNGRAARIAHQSLLI